MNIVSAIRRLVYILLFSELLASDTPPLKILLLDWKSFAVVVVVVVYGLRSP